MEVVKKCLFDFNLYIDIKIYVIYFFKENVLDLLVGYDFVVDGMDNFFMCYLVNDVCILSGLFYVYGFIFCFEG